MEQNSTKSNINWDSGAYRKLPVTIGISDFQKIHLAYFSKKISGKENKLQMDDKNLVINNDNNEIVDIENIYKDIKEKILTARSKMLNIQILL